MVGNLITAAIITKGLHGGSACKGIITAHFSLYAFSVEPPKIGGGGPYPGPAWNKISNIQQFYKPTEQQPYVIPRDKEADYFRRNLVVTFTIKFGDTVTEKTFIVPQKQRQIVVKIFNFIDATRKKIGLVVDSIRVVSNKIKFAISTIRIKKGSHK